MVNTGCITPVNIKQLHVPETFFFHLILSASDPLQKKKTNGEESTAENHHNDGVINFYSSWEYNINVACKDVHKLFSTKYSNYYVNYWFQLKTESSHRFEINVKAAVFNQRILTNKRRNSSSFVRITRSKRVQQRGICGSELLTPPDTRAVLGGTKDGDRTQQV